MSEIVLKDEAYKIMGACFAVHNELGPGFLEAVYQEALEEEFNLQDIVFHSQPKLTICYKEKKLNTYYQADFVCYDQVLIEIKAIKELADTHRAQVINYLRATNLPLGLLINFGSHGKLEHERIALTTR